MRCLLLTALLAEFHPPDARTQPRAAPAGADDITPTVRIRSVFRWLAMLLWLCIAIHPKNPPRRAEIPF